MHRDGGFGQLVGVGDRVASPFHATLCVRGFRPSLSGRGEITDVTRCVLGRFSPPLLGFLFAFFVVSR